MHRAALVLALVVALTTPPTAAQGDVPADARATALTAALAYLEAEAPGPSARLIEALSAADKDARGWPDPGRGPLDGLPVPSLEEDVLGGVRAFHAVAASGYDPRSFQDVDDDAPRDLVAELRDALPAARASTGMGDDAFALLALVHAGVDRADPDVAAMVTALQEAQAPEGGWTCFGPPSVDCTGYALVALHAAGAAALDPGAAGAFLAAHRDEEGGFRSDGTFVTEANADSTAWALHAYAALGDPAPNGTWAWLLARQTPSGGFAWKNASEGPDLGATLDVLPLLHREAGTPWLRYFREAGLEYRVRPEAGKGAAIVDLLPPGYDRVTWVNEGGDAATGNPGYIPIDPGETRVVHLHGVRGDRHVRMVLTLTAPTPETPPATTGEDTPAAAPALLALALLASAAGRRPR